MFRHVDVYLSQISEKRYDYSILCHGIIENTREMRLTERSCEIPESKMPEKRDECCEHCDLGNRKYQRRRWSGPIRAEVAGIRPENDIGFKYT